ncbi:Protein SABRE, partial [Spiromyces aspiralis]
QFHEFQGGVDARTVFIVAEPVPGPRSVRNYTIPIGIRSAGPSPSLDDTILHWSMPKSLVFPRIYSTFSVLLNSLPAAPVLSNHRPEERHELPAASSAELGENPITPSILITWGACLQSSITAVTQRFESLSKPAADPSPSTGWWDKFRSRMHYRGRVAVVEAPPPPSQPGPTNAPRPGVVSLDAISSSQDHLSDLLQGSRDPQDNGPVVRPAGEILFYFRGGRDPYEVCGRSRGLLFSCRDNVRISIGEDNRNPAIIPRPTSSAEGGQRLGTGSSDDNPLPPKQLNELIKLRCSEFLVGPPIIRSVRSGEIDPVGNTP